MERLPYQIFALAISQNLCSRTLSFDSQHSPLPNLGTQLKVVRNCPKVIKPWPFRVISVLNKSQNCLVAKSDRLFGRRRSFSSIQPEQKLLLGQGITHQNLDEFEQVVPGLLKLAFHATEVPLQMVGGTLKTHFSSLKNIPHGHWKIAVNCCVSLDPVILKLACC